MSKQFLKLKIYCLWISPTIQSRNSFKVAFFPKHINNLISVITHDDQIKQLVKILHRIRNILANKANKSGSK